ncbi:MAG TPA: hypothetical protein VLH08_14490, partial [Acidobacteriota bacterium]|nr:hypothetical protein [Acidobacteriota bacterium]
FNRLAPTGVRLNTPFSLQSDQPAYLESPLNYKSYQGGLLAPYDDRWIAPPILSLAHSFCGIGANDIAHTSGCGFLKLTRIWPPELRDHRVYSSNTLIHQGSAAITSVGALGVSIATLRGEGRVSARLRSFSVSINHALPQP